MNGTLDSIVDRLFNNVRSDNVTFDWTLEKFVVFHADQPIVYNGIHSLMNQAFFPDFELKKSYQLARKPAGAKSDRPDPKKQRGAYLNWAKKKQAPKRKAGGTIVHSQMQHFVNRAGTGSGSGAEWGDSLATVWPKEHPWFSQLKRELNSKQYLPVYSEYTLFDELIGYATNVDLLCFDQWENRLVVVEIKTGYEHNFETPIGKIAGPFSAFFEDDRLSHQALVQALLPCITLHCFYGVLARPEVWHVCDTGVRTYTISTDLVKPDIYETCQQACVLHLHRKGIKPPTMRVVEKEVRTAKTGKELLAIISREKQREKSAISRPYAKKVRTEKSGTQAGKSLRSAKIK